MTALRLADQGCHIALNYVHSKVEAELLQAQIIAKGVRCIAIQADISKVEEIHTLVTAVETQLGHVDILVNNAGPFVRERRVFADYSEAEVQMLVQGNLLGPMILDQLVLPEMRRKQWEELFISASVTRVKPDPGHIVPCMLLPRLVWFRLPRRLLLKRHLMGLRSIWFAREIFVVPIKRKRLMKLQA